MGTAGEGTEEDTGVGIAEAGTGIGGLAGGAG